MFTRDRIQTPTRRGIALDSAIGAALIAGALAQSATAQTTQSTAEEAAARGTLETITVTAQKRTEIAQDIPVSITALSADALESQAIRSSADLGTAIPSLVFNAGKNGNPYIRGVGAPVSTAGNQSSVAMYIDDVLLISPLQGTLAFNNVERVEVLKGPQGTLFGRNANGGVISIRTPDPSQTPSANVSVGYGNFETVESKFYGNTALTDTMAANLAVYYYNRMDGWGTNRTTGKDSYRERSFDARAKFAWNPSEDTEVIFSFDHQKNRNELTGARLLKGTVGRNGALPPQSFYDTNNNFPSYSDTEVDSGSLRVTTAVGGATFRSITAYTAVDTLWSFDSDHSALSTIEGPIWEDAKGFTQEFHLLSPEEQKLRWMVGLFYLNGDASFWPIRLFGSNFGAAIIDVYGHTSSESYAAFGQMTWEFLPDTNLTLGARHTWDYRTVDGHTDVNFVPGTQAYQEKSFREPTYRVSLDHRLNDMVMVYGTVSTGFNAGQYNTGNAAAPAVDPEKMKAYEVGIKTDLFDNRLQLNLAAFYYDYEDLQVTVVQEAVTVQTNAAAARIEGAELELHALPLPDLRVDLGVAYTDARYTDYRNAQFYVPTNGGGYVSIVGDASDNQLVSAPRFTATLGLSHEAETSIGLFNTSMNVSHKGKIYGDYANTFFTKETTLLAASLTWAPSSQSAWDITLWGRNLTDEKYQSTSVRLEGAMATPGEPRAYGAAFRARF